MKVGSSFALLALAVASGTACAQRAGDASLAREEVQRQVLEARANGALRHAGEPGPRGDAAYAADVAAVPTLTRAQQNALVLQARRDRELAHAGPMAPEDDLARARAPRPTSVRTRAEVKEQVPEALADARLNPGGAGEYPDLPYRRSAFAKTPDTTERTVAARDK